MLRNKIVRSKKIYKFDSNHFLIECIVFGLVVINTIKDQTFNFLAKLYGMWKNVTNKSCSRLVSFVTVIRTPVQMK